MPQENNANEKDNSKKRAQAEQKLRDYDKILELKEPELTKILEDAKTQLAKENVTNALQEVKNVRSETQAKLAKLENDIEGSVQIKIESLEQKKEILQTKISTLKSKNKTVNPELNVQLIEAEHQIDELKTNLLGIQKLKEMDKKNQQVIQLLREEAETIVAQVRDQKAVSKTYEFLQMNKGKPDFVELANELHALNNRRTELKQKAADNKSDATLAQLSTQADIAWKPYGSGVETAKDGRIIFSRDPKTLQNVFVAKSRLEEVIKQWDNYSENSKIGFASQQNGEARLTLEPALKPEKSAPIEETSAQPASPPEVLPVTVLTSDQLISATWLVKNGEKVMGTDGLSDDDIGFGDAKLRVSEEELLLFIDHFDALGDIAATLLKGKEVETLQRMISAQTQTEPVKKVTSTDVSARPRIDAQMESVEVADARTITLPRNASFQIEVSDDATRSVYNLYTVSQNTTKTHHGPVRIQAEGNEWKVAVPPDFRGSMHIVQSGAGKRYVYGKVDSFAKEPVAVPRPSVAVQREVSVSTFTEYFRKPGGIDRLNSRVLKMFEAYSELIADRKECGGGIKWQTYEQEAKQLSSRYNLALSNTGSWPTDDNNRIALLAVADEFEQLLADYQSDRSLLGGNPPVVEDGPWEDSSTAKLSPNARLNLFSEQFAKLSSEYNSTTGKTKEVWMALNKSYTSYYNIHQRARENRPVDMRLIGATLTQMERLLHYYTPKLQASKEAEQESTTEGLSAQAKFGNLLTKARDVVKGVVQQSADEPELQKRLLEGMFKQGQPRFDIRQKLIFGSTMKPLPKLAEKEVESLLYLRAHLPDFAGVDGKLNAHDLSAVVDNIYHDVMARPHDLHKKILAEKKIPAGSFEDVGLQKALGLVSDMTAQEASQFNQGIEAEQRPLMRWFFRTFRSNDYNRLQQAKMQLDLLYAVRAQIPVEVRANIDRQLKTFIQKAHLPIHAGKRDTGHGRLSEADMREFEKHAGVLKAVGERALKDVRALTGASIETYLPDGLSVEFIDWMLDAQTRPDGRKGTAPGSYFWIEGAPVSRTAKRESIATKDTATEDRELAVDLKNPSTGLGEPSPIGELNDTKSTPEPPSDSSDEELITPFTQVEYPELKIENVSALETDVPKAAQERAEAQAIPEKGIVEITSFGQLARIVSASKKRILIDFGATWCGPCHQMKDTVNNLKKDYLILTVDGDQNTDIVKAYRIGVYPSFIVAQNDKLLERMTGLKSESQLRTSLTDPNEGISSDSIISSVTPPQPAQTRESRGARSTMSEFPASGTARSSRR